MEIDDEEEMITMSIAQKKQKRQTNQDDLKSKTQRLSKHNITDTQKSKKRDMPDTEKSE